MKLILFSTLFIFSSCSLLISPEESKNHSYNKRSVSTEDYRDHLESLNKVIKQNKENKFYEINTRDRSYLNSITRNLIENNELFFNDKTPVEVNVIYSKTPFHFSLPGEIYLSSSLITNYIKSESLLYSVITYELIRSKKNLYNRLTLFPVDSITINELMSLLRLGLEDKIEMHKWAFYILNRVNVEADSYLFWLQIQNRNSTDFSMQLGDVNSISREESLFKSFLIKNSKKINVGNKYEGSSKSYYNFINSLKRNI